MFRFIGPSTDPVNKHHQRRHDSYVRRRENSINLLRREHDSWFRQMIKQKRKHDFNIAEVKKELCSLGKVSKREDITAMTSKAGSITFDKSPAKKSNAAAYQMDLSQNAIQHLTSLSAIRHKQIPIRQLNDKSVRSTLPPCAYVEDKQMCNDHPCVVPLTYTHMTHQTKPDRHLLNYKPLLNWEDNSKGELHFPENEAWMSSGSIRRLIRSQKNDRLQLMEICLNNITRSIQRRHRKLSVPDWEIMYGEGLSVWKDKKLKTQLRTDAMKSTATRSDVNDKSVKRFRH